jgi:hypothetical protein
VKKSGVNIRKDRMPEVLDSVHTLAASQVLIGIPQATAERGDEATINNAQIGYIQEFGSPVNNIPARPFLVPGVQKAKAPVAKALRRAAEAALAGRGGEVEKALTSAGEAAVVSVRAKLEEGPFVPLSPATIRSRMYQRDTKSRRKSEQRYLKLLAEGDAVMTPAKAQAMANIKPLINTGELKKAIRAVIRKKK